MLPTLIGSAFFASQTGHWWLVLTSATSAVLFLLVALWRKSFSGLVGGVSFDGKNFWLANRKLTRLALIWPTTVRHKITEFLRERAAEPERQAELEQLRARNFELPEPNLAFLGYQRENPVGISLIAGFPHLLVCGATGAGKSVLLAQLINSWLAQNTDSTFFLIDFKAGETFAKFESRNRVRAVVTDQNIDETAELVNSLEALLAYREAEVNFRHTPCYVVIDEFPHFMNRLPKALPVIENIVARGRSLGFRIILSTQSTAAIPRSLLGQLRRRLAVGQFETIDWISLGADRQSIQKLPGHSADGWGRAALISVGEATEFFEFPLPILST
jgi:FtsK/SpoIIIE family